jgi:hypothetical protein
VSYRSISIVEWQDERCPWTKGGISPSEWLRRDLWARLTMACRGRQGKSCLVSPRFVESYPPRRDQVCVSKSEERPLFAVPGNC